MPFQTSKNQENGKSNRNNPQNSILSEKMAFLTALSLFLSYAEMLLPRFTPFFKLGLTNIIILGTLDLSFPYFLVLIIVKTVTGGIFNGTLFSPFFLISIVQAFVSGISMFFLNKLNVICRQKFCSLYGISIFGAAISSFIQILLCSFYVGKSTFALLAPMLVFSILSGFVTAFLCLQLNLQKIVENNQIKISHSAMIKEESSENLQKHRSLFFSVIILVLCVTTFFLKNIYVSLLFMTAAFIIQTVCRRKIKIIIYVWLWLFVILFSLFVPNGKVLLKIRNFSVTQGALISGIVKAAKLSAAASFSQSVTVTSLSTGKTGFLSLVINYFTIIIERFKTSQGNVFQRIKNTVCYET